MKARDVMTSPVIAVGPQATIKEAARLLADHRISGLPVVDRDGDLVGIVTEADLIRLESTPESPRRTSALPLRYGRPPSLVAHVMTPDPVVVSEEADIGHIADLLLRTGFRRVPVVRGRRVVGVVSRHDLVRLLATDDDLIAAGVRRLLREHGGRVVAYGVKVQDGIVELRGEGDQATMRTARALARRVAGVLDVRVATH